MQLERNKILAPFTTFKIGGIAAYFTQAQTVADLVRLLELPQLNSIPIFILGGGSNLLIRDRGIEGLVVKIEFDAIKIKSNIEVKVGAGVGMPTLVSQMCNLGLKGLEWAGGLPGTLGGAIAGNAGCFGSEIKDIIVEVTALDLKTKNLRVFTNAECLFTYRRSFFKDNQDWLIIDATLKFEKGDKAELLKVMQDKIQYRQDRHPLDFPNVGSIFKNILWEKAPESLQKLAQENQVLRPSTTLKIPTAFVIEQCGLKGKEIGGAKISPKHANFIINFNHAKAQNVLDLIAFIKEEVFNQFKIRLEEEIQIVGSEG